MMDELGGKIMAKFFVLRSKVYSYLTDDSNENENTKGKKMSVIKRVLKFKDYKNHLEANLLGS